MLQNSKAQASVEFLILLAATLLIITIVVMMSQGQVTSVQNIKDQTDAQNSLLDLSSAAKEVYAQGEGSKKHVYIQLPSSYEPTNSSVGNRTIRIRAAGTDHVAIENFKVRGYLPATPGGHWVWVVSEGNRVRIGDAMMELDRNRIFIVMECNTTTTTSFSVKNIWSKNINISTITEWTNEDVPMSGVPSAFSLSTNDIHTIDLQFAAGPDSGGSYYGQIELNAVDETGSSESVDIPVTVEVIACGQQQPTIDILGPFITWMYHDPSPAIKLQPLVMFVNASDVLTGNHSIKGCQIDADNANNWTNMLPTDGAYDQTIELSQYNYTNGFVLGPHIIRAKCTDSLNNTGPTAYYYFNVSEIDMLGPIMIKMNHTEWPTTLSNISIAGITTDAYTGNNNIQTCNVKIDSGLWNTAIPVDGAWDSPTENLTYNVGPLGVGYHTAYYQCTDSLGNIGGIYNDSFGIVDVDMMIVLDRSGSMDWNVTNQTNNNIVSASSTGWSWVKNMTVEQKNGDTANLTVETRASASGCTVYYNATINGVQVATGSRTSTSYGSATTEINISNYEPPYTVTLWLKKVGSSCTVYDRLLSVQQLPKKMDAVKVSSKSFLDIAGNNILAGLVSYSTSATTDRTLALMGTSNQTALKNSIDALSPYGSTCIECGLDNACAELVSSRARPLANKVVILLTDGVSNVGDSVSGAVYCRDRDVVVYTIGFGNDVNDVELTNIALLTHGDYYFAPNAQTLTAIFNNIGR
ncbi:von Willebrand factor type A domain protein [Candidatus Bilamarchaeum dharawalense]|uniref:von Willebrand factor type A domain protein n=1 Tax=Candidatus Bilamarchaeum dharawalense TaxID=2885759 RepID=A0A5E4LLJ5_9ARCH|nr:von Willebrand factor type A domain protein [Candidatus Bilamarchaeum dharawalense]